MHRKDDDIEEEDFELFGGAKSAKKQIEGDTVARRSTVCACYDFALIYQV